MQAAEVEGVRGARLPGGGQHLAAGPGARARACSAASVLPSSGMNALQAHQVSTAMTATNTPLTVAAPCGVNSSRGVGRAARARLSCHGSLSRRNSRTPSATSRRRPARNT